MFRNLIAIAFLSLVLVGCHTPEPYYKIKPVTNDVEWHLGKAVIIDSTDDAVVQISFSFQDDQMAFYDIVYINKSDSKVIADPGNVRQKVALNGRAEEFYDMAFDPVQMIDEINISRRQMQADRLNQRTANIALFAIGVVAEAADDDDDFDPDLAEDAIIMEIAESANHKDRMAYLKDRESFIRNQAYSKTTLFPNRFLDGWIAFPFHPDAKFYEIVVPTQNEDLRFLFSQERVL
jgi:hypothetical protein